MMIGIHKELYGKFSRSLEIYEEILYFNKVESVRMDSSDSNFLDKLKDIQFFIFRWSQYDDYHQQAKTILPIVENIYKIKCFPDQNTCWHYDDKIRQYYLLKSHGFPVVDSYIFWDYRKALEWLKEARFPVVFKLRGGAGSSNVILVDSLKSGKKLVKNIFNKGIRNQKIKSANAIQKQYFNPIKKIRRLGGDILRKLKKEDPNKFWQLHKNYVYFQKYLPGNKYDTRITTIRNRAFGFIRYVRPGDFRASGSGLLNYDIEKIDKRCIKIALDISKKLKFQSMAYDFIFDSNGNPQICEISYNYLDKPVFDCSGYWDENIEWQEGHFWPQYFHLKDLLGIDDFQQPNIKW